MDRESNDIIIGLSICMVSHLFQKDLQLQVTVIPCVYAVRCH